MTLSITVCIAFLVAAFATGSNSIHPLSDEFISQINSKQSTWKAGRNFSPNTPLTYIKKLVGVNKNSQNPYRPVKTYDADLIYGLPKEFDVRKKWPNCPSLNEIIDQGACGSGWAVAAVSTMTDRVCTYSNGTKHFSFSASDVMSCCKTCGHGCIGGSPSQTWTHWMREGIVSGGWYNSSQGCKAYEFPPCEHYVEGNRPKCVDDYNITKCVPKCQTASNLEYDKDKRYGKGTTWIQGDFYIQKELLNGPVEAGIEIYDDFLHYKNGVYSHTLGNYTGDHAVKILGWGVENGTDYWLCANSWNSDWGDNGFFKILRGVNECGIEDDVNAGVPNLTGL